MEESLSFAVTFEGGQPSVQLVVLEGYRHPDRILEIPLGLLDFRALVRSAQATGDYWIVNTTPDLPDFQVESAVFVRHRDGKILWDIVYEHYEPFLHVELDMEDDEPADEFDENIITLTFDPFQYVSALYQFCQAYPQFKPVTFQPQASEDGLQLESFLPQLYILWRRHGETHGAVNAEGVLITDTDSFSRQAEEQWTDEVLRALLEMRFGRIMGNIDAYLDSLPPDVLAKLEADSAHIETALNERWSKLVNSLTEEEAEDLENEQSKSKFPNSLKLRLMREFLSGNPSVLLGYSHEDENPDTTDKVISLANWKKDRQDTSSSQP
ncbi:MAG TPA: hypothetical protein PLE99_02710 [Candidatus Thiothrix moscowensis]|uniref:hypothetical protein n=1 Tax=unclassified Thiothrix TaxID=2636184 RepID=UPI0025DE9338|nr:MULTISPECIES: hypothetical protein [unclassified Thiothrix]HRJ51653.1 hypothetical protein [Candidatus Thiothrix moscowensis]HRJ91968.1 hypothetical protein [Candidatus Thiothrix moscowensis]